MSSTAALREHILRCFQMTLAKKKHQADQEENWEICPRAYLILKPLPFSRATGTCTSYYIGASMQSYQEINYIEQWLLSKHLLATIPVMFILDFKLYLGFF